MADSTMEGRDDRPVVDAANRRAAVFTNGEQDGTDMTYKQGDYVRLISTMEIDRKAQQHGWIGPQLKLNDLGVVLCSDKVNGVFEIRFPTCTVICSEAMIEPAPHVVVSLTPDAIDVDVKRNLDPSTSWRLHGPVCLWVKILTEVATGVGWKYIGYTEDRRMTVELWREK